MNKLPGVILFLLIAVFINISEASDLPPVPREYLKRVDIQSIDDPVPATGQQKMLVILADFSDEMGIFTQDAVYRQFFDTSSSSFAAYFDEVSYNKLQFTGDVVGLSGGQPVANSTSAAWVRLPNPKSFYAAGNQGMNVSDFPRNIAGIYYHAVQQLESSGFDFSPYADSTTKELKNVIVLYAGRSSVESSNLNDLQPTAYRLAYYFSGSEGYVSSAGYVFDSFTLCPERNDAGAQSEIGICAHEHGHAMGMVDLYDFSYTTSGAGYYDLMCYGTYGPFHPSAFSKIFYQWITPMQLVAGSHTIILSSFEDQASVLQLFPGNGATSEYFLLTNRQLTGFDSGMNALSLCSGLYIWHIDENTTNAYWDSNRVNSIPSAGGPAHPGVALVEADGNDDLRSAPINFGQCSDSWKTGDTWDASSTASSRLWNGTDSGLSVEVISSNNGVLTLSVNVPEGAATPAPGSESPPTPTPTPDAVEEEISLTLREIKKAKTKYKAVARLKGSVSQAGNALIDRQVSLVCNGKDASTRTSNARGAFSFKQRRPKRGRLRCYAKDQSGAVSRTVRIRKKKK